METQGLLGRGRGEKRLRVTRPQPRDVSSGVSRALALHDVTFLELWEAMMAIEPAAAQYAAVRRTATHLRRAGPRRRRASSATRRDTAAAVSAVVDFFTAVAAASGNQVLALSQAPLNLLLAPTLTRLIDRVPQARQRIGEAQGRITSAIKLRRSELARTWMEKHIRDFKRGYELGVFLEDLLAQGVAARGIVHAGAERNEHHDLIAGVAEGMHHARRYRESPGLAGRHLHIANTVRLLQAHQAGTHDGGHFGGRLVT